MMIFDEQLMRIRQKEILDEAERNRLANSIKPSHDRRRRSYARMLTWTGNKLLNWGVWLTTRFGDTTILSESGALENRIQGIH